MAPLGISEPFIFPLKDQILSHTEVKTTCQDYYNA